MTPSQLPLLVAALLAATALLAMLRLFRLRNRFGPARLIALLLAQPLLAALLYYALFPPLLPTNAGTMAVLTTGASTPTPGELRIALPGAPANAAAEPMPDLATALRLHPGVNRLHVIGEGLDTRDIEAASPLPTKFTMTAAPVGLVELQAPTQVAAGNAFTVRGRVDGLSAAAVDLHDPAGHRVQRSKIDAQGRFALQGETRAEGLATFSLRVSGKDGRLHETLPLPMWIEAPQQPRVLVLAGAPTPELKYLRRWATDAGIALQARISTGGGLTLGDAPSALHAAGLRRFDAVILDVRSLRALDRAQLATFTAAMRDGLGVIMRVDEPLLAADRARLRGWGLVLDAGQATEPTQIARDAALPPLTRRVLRIDVGDAVPILRDARDRPLATWRMLGRGRVAVLALDDTHRLVLGGHAARHAGIWSRLLAAVSRSHDAAQLPSPASPLWPDERVTLCGLGSGASVLAPGGDAVPLVVDPATGTRRCAAFWPRSAGWHLVRHGDAEIPFAVLPNDAGASLRAQRRRDATLALVAQRNVAPALAGAPRRGPSWPWFAAWLALAVLTWWFERRRAARIAPVPPATIA